MNYDKLKKHTFEKKIEVVGKCPKCGGDLLLKKLKGLSLEVCINYPQCLYIYSEHKTGIKANKKCPKCGGELLIKTTKRGKKFLDCENYPQCLYSEWIGEDSRLDNGKIKSVDSEDDNNINNSKEKSPCLNNFKDGSREDVQEDVRSSWEANIIRLFNYLHIDYKYESDVYDLNGGNNYKYSSYAYVPDFVLEDGTLIEVKGNLDYRSLQNLKLFQELYPNEKIIIIDRDIYYLLEKKYGGLINNWEKKPISTNCYINVVGINIKERKKYVDKLEKNDELFIIRDLENEYDKNAIKVVDKDSNHLGYIASEYACYYAPKIDKGIKYSLSVIELAEKKIKCKIKPINLDAYDVSRYYNLF